MSERGYVECPGCGRTMGRLPVKFIEELNKFETRLFCPCGWTAPMGRAKTAEEAIDMAFIKAKWAKVED